MKIVGILALVFSLVILIVIAMQSWGANEKLHNEYQQRIYNEFEKIALINEQILVMHQRQRLIQQMAITKDLFLRDELFLEHSQLAVDFNSLRSRLRALDISDQERRMLDQQQSIMSSSYPMQLELSEKLRIDEDYDADDIINNKLPPLLDNVNSSMARQRDLITELSMRSIEKDHKEMNKERSFMLFSYGAVFLFLLLAVVFWYLWQRRYNNKLKVALSEMKAAHGEKDRFLSSMSHELRTPLNAIIGFTDLMLVSPKIDSTQEQSLRHVMNAGEHLLELVDDVLDLAKIESGEIELNIRRVPLRPLVEDCFMLLASLAEKNNIDMSFDCECGCEFFVKADYRRLKQSLINLLSNACKYSDAGSSVVLSCGRHGEDQLKIKVSDSGPGIEKHRMKELFEPFKRLGAENSKVQGTGIGLSITKKLVEGMSGKIGVESKVGRGSQFWITLPITSSVMIDDASELENCETTGSDDS